MPPKVRELVADLERCGFVEIRRAGKGSHRKFLHPRFQGAVTVSGRSGDDAKPYQERQIQRVIEEVTG